MININQNHSINYGSRAGWRPDVIVCHITDGSFDGAVSWLCGAQSGISAHFVVARDGRIAQLVDLRQAAYCNGTQSGSPGGYEYVGRATAALVRSRRVNANLYTVSIECEGDDATHGILTDAQFTALVELIGYIRAQVKAIYGTDIPCDRTHILGHCEIAPVEKPDCPGRSFPWTQLTGALNVLPPILHMDIPAAGEAVTDVLGIAGWALGDIARVDLYADTGNPHPQPLGSAKVGHARPDVATVYPAYKDAAASGWGITASAGVLSPGAHTIDAAAIGKDGKLKAWGHVKIAVK